MACSSVVERVPVKHRVEGSSPSGPAILLALAAALPGADFPRDDAPGPPADLYVLGSNDDLLPKSPDDNVTASTRLGFASGPVLVGLDAAMLTDRRSGSRVDEATLSGGLTRAYGALQAGVAGGLRLSGDLGGQRLQDAWHHATGDNEVHFAYASFAAFPVLSADLRFTVPFGEPRLTAEVAPTHRYGSVALSLPAVLRTDPDFEAWIGPTWVRAFGSTSAPQRAVNGRFDGIGISAGFLMEFVEIALTASGREGYGTLGARISR